MLARVAGSSRRLARVPALQAGPGDLPMVQAQALLLEKITAANCAKARQHAGDQ